MLVHEAYVRLVDVDQQQQWNSRGHFFGAAAEAMRRILVEKARQKQRAKKSAVVDSPAQIDVLCDSLVIEVKEGVADAVLSADSKVG